MPDLKEVLEAAEYAKVHARSRICKGSNHHDGMAKQLSSDIDQRDALHQSIIEMRDLIHDESKITPNPLEKNYTDLLWFETNIKFSTKYSLGNCYEYTLQALDYILQKNPDIDGEIFRILRGDHFFLVLNRDPNSDPNKPETWGAAVICDPWLNAVYEAKEYQSRLSEVFDPDKGHKIVIGDASLTVASLYDVRTIENLEANFLQEIKALNAYLKNVKIDG